MKPSRFEYFVPGDLKEAVDLLESHGDDAKILAGGQSLIPMMNFRLAQPKILIDLNRLPGLSYVRDEGDTLAIGALTRIREIETSPLVRSRCPILSEAASFIGHVPNRTRGTVGGSVAHADPSAELPTVLTALQAEVKVVGPSGDQTYSPEDFFLSYLTTPLGPGDIVTEIRVPAPNPAPRWAFLELSRRHGDFAIVAVALLLNLAGDGVCSSARVAAGGVSETPLRARGAEDLLVGQRLTDELVEKAARAAAEETDPETDYHASAEYRREMTRVFTARALHKAWRGEGEGSE
jgi:CO/xanthine dehydrogenase FAD-binding subunit